MRHSAIENNFHGNRVTANEYLHGNRRTLMFSMVFLRFYAYLIKYLKKNVIFVFHELYRINYVKSAGLTNIFPLQYRAPPELTEF